MKKESFVKIGYVMKTHGLKGEVTLNLSPESPELASQDLLMIESNGGMVPYFIQGISYKGDKAYLKLEDVNTFEKASELKGCSIYFEKSKRPKLKRGEYYDDELIGFEVVDKTNGSLGEVVQISSQGLSRLMEIKPIGSWGHEPRPEGHEPRLGEKVVLIPMNGPFIKSISKTKKKIEVELPEGFLEI
jgi:16S rRNA processing protein RimM